MNYTHKNGRIYDTESNQTIASMNRNATSKQANLLTASPDLLDVAIWLVQEYENEKTTFQTVFITQQKPQ